MQKVIETMGKFKIIQNDDEYYLMHNKMYVMPDGQETKYEFSYYSLNKVYEAYEHTTKTV